MTLGDRISQFKEEIGRSDIRGQKEEVASMKRLGRSDIRRQKEGVVQGNFFIEDRRRESFCPLEVTLEDRI